MSEMNEDECDHDDGADQGYMGIVGYRLQTWDLLNIGVTWAANLCMTTGGALGAVAYEITAHANYVRAERDEYRKVKRADVELLEFLERKDS